MPALSVIDLAYQFLIEHGHNPQGISLQSVCFLKPIYVEDACSLRLLIEGEATETGWRIVFLDASGVKYVTLDAAPTATMAARRIALPAEGEFTTALSTTYAQCHHGGLTHSGFMQASGFYALSTEGLTAHLSLPEAARLSAQEFLFHPTLLDAASLVTGMIFASSLDGDNPLFMPLSLERFDWLKPLQTDGYVQVLRTACRQEDDRLSRDIVFADDTGEVVAQLIGFTCARLRDAPSDSLARQLTAMLAAKLDLSPARIRPGVGFHEQGLDSAQLLEMSDEIRRTFQVEVPPTLLFEHPTIDLLAAHLAGHQRMQRPVPPPARISPKPTGNAPIAIIGIAGRYPNSPDLETFWQNLAEGVDCITEIPLARWDHRDYAHLKSRTGRPISQWGGFVAHHDSFDAQFFRISPREAAFLDPQERLFLETCWEAIENAGHTPETLTKGSDMSRSRRVGVFAGVMHKDYTLVVAAADNHRTDLPMSLNTAQIANRVSYFCDFHGPSVTVDTVCSSSLVAVHMAVESLRSGEASACIAGGVNLSLHPAKYKTYGQGDLFSTDGRCRAFGKDGDGYVPAEGVGAVVLKPLEAAITDGDPIHAVIAGSATNHVGLVSGFTVPSPNAQAELITRALHNAGLAPDAIGAVEAHGTGTSLGDPIEVEGLKAAFGNAAMSADQPIALGSVKSNIGHAEAAAGISGLTKMVLQLKHGRLAPSLHADPPNPHIDLTETPFTVQTTLAPWPRPDHGGPRIGGVSAFGATGTNAHVIVQEAPVLPVNESRTGPVWFILSAQDNKRLQAYAARVARFLRLQPSIDLHALAYTYQSGRIDLPTRFAAYVTDSNALSSALEAFSARGTLPALSPDLPQVNLLQDWLAGQPLDRRALSSGGHPPRRVHAPTYPFKRERHWVGSKSKEHKEPPVRPPVRTEDTLMATPYWTRANGTSSTRQPDKIILIEREGTLPSHTELPDITRWTFATDSPFEDVAAKLFLAIKAASDIAQNTLWQVLVVEAEFEALGVMAQSTAIERAGPQIQILRLPQPTFGDQTQLKLALEEASTYPSTLLRLEADGWQERRWKALAQHPGTVPWQPGKVYLITGGNGGLGRLFTTEIMKHAPTATVILIGRSPAPSPDPDERPNVIYRSADIADPAAVHALIGQIIQEFGRIDGVLHSAGVLDDGLIAHKTEQSFRTVLAPKVAGTSALMSALAPHTLDFLVLFSSGAGAFGNTGQVDYATANAWLGTQSAQTRPASAIRPITIHWPLWADGGMRPSDHVLAHWKAQFGFQPLATPDAFAAFYAALQSGAPETLVLSGDTERLTEHFKIGLPGAPLKVHKHESDKHRVTRKSPAHDAVLEKLRKGIASVTELPAAQVKDTEPLVNYGLDSVMVVELGHIFAEISEDISHNLYYENNTLLALAQAIMADHEEAAESWYAGITAAPEPATPDPETVSTPAHEPIAIIGMAARFPDAPDLAQFWLNLLAGKDCIREIPAERWSMEGFHEPDRAQSIAEGKSYAKWGGFLEDFAAFDPLFFRISPMEAAAIDPQERIFLQTAWHALEDAGYSPDHITQRFDGRVGVFAGITRTGFNLNALDRWRDGDAMLPSTSFSSVANRVSYLMNFKGPSVPVDTMCSSSLTAVHQACEALRRGDCEIALAGGVNLLLHPLNFISASAQQMLSPDGRCKTFGIGANGYVPGEGVGIIVLKRQHDADRDNDMVHARILSTAINHNGRTNGYTVPNPKAQQELLCKATKAANIDSSSISYIEAHGTGTELGDPIEIEAIGKALKPVSGSAEPTRWVGSVKSNIGHLEAAAGIAGLLKTVMQLKHKKIVPSLHSETPNPKILFRRAGLLVPQAAMDWTPPDGEAPLRAGVSSFGAGGANAHVILEEAGPALGAQCARQSGEDVAIIFSAKSEPALVRLVQAMAQHLTTHAPALQSLAYTLQTGREEMSHRLAFVVTDLDQLKDALKDHLAGKTPEVPAFQGSADDYALDTVVGDAEFDEVPETWLAQREMTRLGKLWVQGRDVDWHRLYQSPPPQRVSLPGYRFEQDIFWTPPRMPARTPDTAVTTASTEQLFRPIWTLIKGARKATPAHGIILHDRAARETARRISAHLPFAEVFAHTEVTDKLEAALKSDQRLPLLVLAQRAPGNEGFSEVALIEMLQKLRAQGVDFTSRDVRFVLIEPKAGDSWGGGFLGLHQALQQTGIPSTCVCLDEDDLEPEIDSILAVTGKTPIRVKDGAFWRQKLQPIDQNQLNAPVALRQEGRYLIIGGSGLVGQIITRHLFDHYNADVTWLGRTAPDDIALQKKLSNFPDENKQLTYVQADIRNAEALTSIAAQNDFTGVIFAAMTFGFGGVFDVDLKTFKTVFDTKELGALNVTNAFKNADLDFICFFSSTQSFTFADAANSVAYAAGITAADAVARAAGKAACYPVGTIHWGFWEPAIAGTILERNSRALTVSDALATFETALKLICTRRTSELVAMNPPADLRGNDIISDQSIIPVLLDGASTGTAISDWSDAPATPQAPLSAEEYADFEQTAGSHAFSILRGLGRYQGHSEQVTIQPRFERWLTEIDSVFEQLGLIVAHSDQWRLTAKGGAIKKPETEAKWCAYKETVGASGPFSGMTALLDRCLKALPEVLSGAVQAPDLIFPKGQINALEDVYENNHWSNFFNEQLARAVVRILQAGLAENPGKTFRIAEIGAGTGSTTRAVLAALEREGLSAEYLYTDISPSFVEHGRRRFGETRPWMSFALWDINQPFGSTGTAWESCDVVLATNVLHATPDICRALQQAKSALHADGYLLINETVWKTLFGTLTFGLLDGWWSFADPGLRIEGSPLLSVEQWHAAFAEAGFRHAKTLTVPMRAAAQAVLVAQNDGWKLAITAESPAAMRPEQPQRATGQTSLAHELVLRCVAKVLNISAERIETTVPFSEYGVDSIVGSQLVNEIGAEACLTLNASILYEHTHVEALGAYLSPLLAKQENQEQLEQPVRDDEIVQPPKQDRIAVIGLACEAPAASNGQAYWEVLCGRKDAGAGRRLPSTAGFDGLFFRIAPREAASMGAHQKLVLESAWCALEDAAILPDSLAGQDVAIYVGAEPSSPVAGASFTGSSDAIIASRLSYLLDLRGPSLVVNTGCSSSAAAIHLACEALRTGKATMALAGGVYANLSPDIAASLSDAGMVSPTNQCRTFDAAADGTVLCEGVGMLVLKRLKDAERDGDPIHGTILASSMNQDGASNGITAPNGASLTQLFKGLYQEAGINPAQITYVEAHGTGTPLGDPVEANALTRAFQSQTNHKHYCHLGSAKAVIGHASAAAGVLGLIKLLLCFRHQHLPGMPTFETLNPGIDLSESAFKINMLPQAWRAADDAPLVAALNSFGHSGTNVHMVLEEPPPARIAAHRPDVSGYVAIPLSADHADGLQAALEALRDFVRPTMGHSAPGIAQLKQHLADMLDVSPDEIDEDEALEDIGVTPDVRLALSKALDPDAGAREPVLLARSLRDLASLIAPPTNDLQSIALTLQRHRQSRKVRVCFLVRRPEELLHAIDRSLTESSKPISVLPDEAPADLRIQAEDWLNGAPPAWPPLTTEARAIHLPVFTYARSEGPDLSGLITFAPRWNALPAPAEPAPLPAKLLLIAHQEDPRLPAFNAVFGKVTLATPTSLSPADFDGQTDICWLDPSHLDGEACLLELLRVLQLARQAHLVRPCWTFVTSRAFALSPEDDVDPFQAALHGIIGVCAKEVTSWTYRALDFPGDWQPNADDLMEAFAHPATARAHPITASVCQSAAPQGLRFFQRDLVPAEQAEGAPPAYRPNGVYIVIGGAGDVGLKWSAHVISQTQAQVIWVGRRAQDDKISSEIERLSRLGPKPMYISADATDPQAMQDIRAKALDLFGAIHGVIHSALHFAESDIPSLTPNDFKAGFQAKALVTDAIETVFGDLPLDFIVMFSSVISLIRNPRQAAYAAGCAYADAKASMLNLRSGFPVKTMNWGYWSSTKDQPADESALSAYLKLSQIGIGLIDAEEGMFALDMLLTSSAQQLGVVKTTKAVDIEGVDRTARLVLSSPEANSQPQFPTVLRDINISALADASDIPGFDSQLLDLLQTQLDEVRASAPEFVPPHGHLQKWYAESLKLLNARQTPLASAPWSRWQALCTTWAGDPGRSARTALVEAALRGLPDILRGTCQPTDILFPEGDLSLVENVHKHNPVADHFHQATAQTVIAACRYAMANHPGRPLRLLEVGAGTGSTTAKVLDAVGGEPALAIGSYHYTDLSAAFLSHGREAFASANPPMVFDRLDISQPVVQQGFAAESYDIVIGGNVLHATPDIRETLDHVKTLLRPGGYLIGCEVSQSALYTHLTFGLLQGWWAVQDAETRIPGCPGLSPEGWRKALALAGFRDTAFPAKHMHALGQQVFVAQSDGVLPEPNKVEPTHPQGLHRYVSEAIAHALGMDPREIDPAEPLDTYGMDSILAVALTDVLNEEFSNISSTLVFDHRTVNEIVEFLTKTQTEAIHRRFPDTPAQQAVATLPNEDITRSATSHKVAIIGMSCRVPGAPDTQAFWDLIRRAESAIGPMPPERVDPMQFEIFQGSAEGLHTQGGYVDDIDRFDPLVFGISKAEATWIDPRQRLFLEESLHAFEDAGLAGDSLRGSDCGVFVGVEEGEYGFLTEGRGQIGSNQIASMAARIAYFFDLKGPNFALSAACASGLLSVHQACQALRNHECSLALAGGVSLVLSPITHLGLAHGNMLSKSGQARVFSPDATGIIPGDAVAAVVLKRYEDALRDGDPIHGILSASAINYDGKTLGMGSPSPRSQASLIEKVYESAKLCAGQVQMVMAHSVGSNLTDHAELEALTQAADRLRGDALDRSQTITSIKPLIGHSFAASGVVNLIAALLAMQHETIPPTLGAAAAEESATRSSPRLKIATRATPWIKTDCQPRRALVGATGLSGTNVQVILEEPDTEPTQTPAPTHEASLFVFSGRTLEALARVLVRFSHALPALNDTGLERIAYTLQIGRDSQRVRAAFTASSREELARRTDEAAAFLAHPHETAPEWLSFSDTQTSAQTLMQMLKGSAGEAFVSTLVAERSLKQIGALWTEGMSIPWQSLYPGKRPRRTRLPGYPFADERYWVPAADTGFNEVITETSSAEQSVKSAIRAFMARQLGLGEDEINDAVSWHDYGADSIFETRLMMMLKENYGVSLKGRDLAQTTSLRGLADSIDELIKKKTRNTESASANNLTHCPLSVGQQGIWWDQLSRPGATSYNIPVAFTITGPWRQSAFEHAINRIWKNHKCLRRVITQDPVTGAPQFRLLPETAAPIEQRQAPARVEVLNEQMQACRQTPFDLEQEPPFRAILWTGQHTSVLLLFHHVVIDGISAGALLAELWQAYQSALGHDTSRQNRPQPADMQEFVSWEARMLQSDEATAHRAFWQDRLKGITAPSMLVGDKVYHPVDPQAPASRGDFFDMELAPWLADALVTRARQSESKVSSLFLLCYQLLISQIARTDEVVIGLATQIRPHSKFEHSIGYFINILPIRTRINRQAQPADAVRALQSLLQDCLDHAAYPLAMIIEDQGMTRKAPLHANFSFENRVPKALSTDTPAALPEIELLEDITQLGEPGLLLEVADTGGAFRLRFKYLETEWSREAMLEIAQAMVRMLTALVDEGTRTLVDVARAGSLPEPFSETIDAPVDVMQRFAGIVENTPDAIALVEADGDGSGYTYRDLDRQVDTLVAAFVSHGLKPGAVVAIFLPRSAASIIAMLGCLKANVTYLPLSAEEPPARLRKMLKDAGTAVIVCDADSVAEAKALCDTPTIVLHRSTDSAPVPLPQIPSDSCAYMLYTSGTTGTPKGIRISRAALNAHIETMAEVFSCQPADRVLQLTPFHLDPSLEQSLVALTTGASLFLRGPQLWPAKAFWDAVEKFELSICDVTPSYLRELLLFPPAACPPALRLMVVGGEAMPTHLAERWRQSTSGRVDLLNAYGLTETTITSAVFRLRADDALPVTRDLPIGRPLTCEAIMILDQSLNPVPDGVAGEIVIGGIGIAQGYVDAAAHGNERFIALPSAVHTQPRLWYRTGDLGRRLPSQDGLIEYLGRTDTQVKLRGMRLELHEVKAAILVHSDVVQTTLRVDHDSTGQRELHACVTLAKGADPAESPARLRDFLKKTLPAGAIPSRINITGEDVLKAPTPDEPDAVAVGLAGIWQDLLGREPASDTEDFFLAGGHSLLALRLLSTVERSYGLKIPVSDFLQDSTFTGLLNHISRDTRRKKSNTWFIFAPGAPHALIRRLQTHPVQMHCLCHDVPANALTLEQLAEPYTAAILSETNPLPIRLGGWSLGGLLAFEVARQLTEKGAPVQHLMLVETYHPALILAQEEETGFEQHCVGVFGEKVSSEMPETLLATARGTYNRQTQMLKTYKPRPYHGKTTIIRAAEELERAQDHSAGFADVLPETPIFQTLLGNHYSILEDTDNLTELDGYMRR